MNRGLLLGVSLLLNVCLLAAAVLWLADRPGRGFLILRESPKEPAATRAQGDDTSRGVMLAGPEPGVRFDAAVADTDEYRRYVANLRAIGCPEATVNEIVIDDVNQLFARRAGELDSDAGGFKFWQTGPPLGRRVPDQETLEARLELARQKRELISELTGLDLPQEIPLFENLDPTRRMLGFLPEDKADRVMRLEQRHAARLVGLMGADADAAELRSLRKEKEAEIARLLTAEQYEEYELRLSGIAMAMRLQLDGFEPTETEFRGIFRLRKRLDEALEASGLDPTDPESVERRREADRELRRGLLELLGEARFREYERIQDPAYQAALKLVQREGLPRTRAVQVWETKNAARDRAHRLRIEGNRSREELRVALEALRSETELVVMSELGPRAFDDYVRGPGGDWLERLARLDPSPDPTEALAVPPPREP